MNSRELQQEISARFKNENARVYVLRSEIKRLRDKLKRSGKLIGELKAKEAATKTAAASPKIVPNITDILSLMDKMVSVQNAAKDHLLAKLELKRLEKSEPVYKSGTAIVGDAGNREKFLGPGNIRPPYQETINSEIVLPKAKVMDSVTARNVIASLNATVSGLRSEIAALRNLNASLQEALSRYKNI